MSTGQPYSNRYISVVVIKDRKVTEWRDYLDPCVSLPPSRDAPSNPTPQQRRPARTHNRYGQRCYVA